MHSEQNKTRGYIFSAGVPIISSNAQAPAPKASPPAHVQAAAGVRGWGGVGRPAAKGKGQRHVPEQTHHERKMKVWQAPNSTESVGVEGS